ncbi:hypothetical protein GR04_25280 [Escherichia coli]|nr:hypothetical protein GR04_25280 [Escherichia coli]
MQGIFLKNLFVLLLCLTFFLLKWKNKRPDLVNILIPLVLRNSISKVMLNKISFAQVLTQLHIQV